MHTLAEVAEKRESLITVLALKRLLVSLKEKRPDICLRYRLLGDMWGVNHVRVIHVTENGVLLNDAHNNKLINLPNLSLIVQFEIDAPFQGYQPHFHYNVKPVANFNYV